MLNISHYDLDGACASMIIKEKYPMIDCVNIGYKDIEEAIYNIEGMYYDEVYITDLHIGNEALKTLRNIVEELPHTKFVFIDHHEYDEEAYEILNSLPDNFEYIIDTTKCATRLTYEYLGMSYKYEDFVLSVDAYDLFKKEDERFQRGFDLNTVFWEMRLERFRTSFRNFDIDSNRYYKEISEKVNEKSEKHFKMLEDNGLSFKKHGIRFIFTSEYLGFINKIYNDNFIIAARLDEDKNVKNISVRFDNMDTDIIVQLRKRIIENAEKLPEYISAGGHKKAFGVTLRACNVNAIEKILEGVMDEINKWAA